MDWLQKKGKSPSTIDFKPKSTIRPFSVAPVKKQVPKPMPILRNKIKFGMFSPISSTTNKNGTLTNNTFYSLVSTKDPVRQKSNILNGLD
jgi:hypothetical protein